MIIFCFYWEKNTDIDAFHGNTLKVITVPLTRTKMQLHERFFRDFVTVGCIFFLSRSVKHMIYTVIQNQSKNWNRKNLVPARRRNILISLTVT